MKSILGIFLKLFTYLGEARQEVKKINWPTGKEVIRKTLIVVVFSAALTGVLGGFDVLFNKGMLELFATQGQQVDIPDLESSNTGTEVSIEDSNSEAIPVEVVSEESVVDETPQEEVNIEE